MNWIQDLRYALRWLRKSPAFSAAIIAVLALGIGINTTVFNLVNAVLMKPLPFPGAERMVIVHSAEQRRPDNSRPMSLADFRDMKAAQKSLERMEAFSGEPMSLGEGAIPPERYRGGRVSPLLFEMLQIKPILGRGFTEEDGKANAQQVVLLGHGVWKTRYGGDSKVIGRDVRVNEKPATIIGVMPDNFKFPNNEDLWMTIIPDAQWEKRDHRRIMAIGLLKPGVTITAADAEFDVLTEQLNKEHPETNKALTARVLTFHQTMNGGQIRLMFLLMLGAVGCVLLIACANVANMLLARAVGRSREMSIRIAIGASRGRVIRQLLVESIVLSVLGGLCGLGLAILGSRAFSLAVSNVGKPYWIDFSLNWMVLAYFSTVCILTGIVFGLAPAMKASRVDLNAMLKEGARGSVGGGSGWLSSILVVLQIALAIILLTGAGLLIRSLREHQSLDATYPADQILNLRASLPQGRYSTPEQRRQFYEQVLTQLTTVPGVQTASITTAMPWQGADGRRFEVEGQPPVEESKRPTGAMNVISPDYFRTIDVKLERGRSFVETDGMAGKEAVIVSSRLAKRYWTNADPTGKRIRIFDSAGKPGPWLSIVGVVPDSLAVFFLNERDNGDPLLYVPHRQAPYDSMGFSLRTSVPPANVVSGVRKEIQKLDADLPLYGVESYAESLYRQRWPFRVFGTIFSIFAVTALLMSAVGLYAVMSSATGRRTQEIGVRVALGANWIDIQRLVMRRGLLQLGLGMMLGLTGAFFVTRLMQSLLVRISPSDPVTFGTVSVVLLTAGLLACWLPARRAASLDPVKALRYE